ncbi:MAG: DUF4129 domain-containing protein [Armatimonadota bacterium]|nr:MAG: DUF4129 domain-containing protein [Armatimonadota bacterium]
MRADRDRLINHAVLYTAAFVVSASGVRAVTMTIGDPAMWSAFVLVLAAGFGVSWLLRRFEQLRPYAVAWTAALGGAALLWYRETGTFAGQPVALAVGPDRQLGLAVLLAALTVVWSFALVRTEDLLFCVVPGLAIFGLLGSKTFDPQFTAAFLVFVFASAYLVGHAHLVAEQQRSRMQPGADARHVARQRFVLLAVLVAFAVGVAVPAARALAAITPGSWSERRIGRGGSSGSGAAGSAGGRPVWTSPRSLRVGAGPIRLSRRVVMRVQCAEPLHWRAGSLAYYTGESWQAANGREAAAVAGVGGRFDLRPLVRAPRGRTVPQRFEFVTVSSALLFAAMQPIEVNLPDPSGARSVFLDYAGHAFGVTSGRLQDSYEVVSQVDNLRPLGPRSILSADAGALLAIPFSAREVEDLARQAVGDVADPAAQVSAIVGWVQARARYSLDAPATPPGEDAVVHFLTRSRVGYCDLFASAVALMCRAQGIPARVAVGFAPGDYDASDGVYVVREEDSHAWVESFLPDEGWITVEASPATGQQARIASQRDWLGRAARFVNRHLMYALALLALLAWAAVVGKGRWLDPYLAMRRREQLLSAQGRRGEVILLYDRLARLLAKRATARRDAETPSEYANRLARNAYLTSIMGGVSAITNAYLAARFSEREVGEQQVAAARQALQEVTDRLRRVKALR